MARKQKVASQPVLSQRLLYPVMVGAGIGLLFIGVFLMGAETNPAWSQYWKIKPLIIVPLAGALGGVFYYFMGNLRSQGGWVKALGILFSFLGYLVILWLGTVFGLNGTLWD